jgi:hypothetical protein
VMSAVSVGGWAGACADDRLNKRPNPTDRTANRPDRAIFGHATASQACESFLDTFSVAEHG